MKSNAPSAERNRQPILDVLRRVLPPRGEVLEIAAGTGQHAAWYAAAFPALRWQPTDRDPGALASIDAWCAEHGGVALPARVLDVHDDAWGVGEVDAVVCINMIHIAPWSATEALARGAARVLRAGAPLYLYGAYKRGGVHTAPSNESFDRWLEARNPRYGVRDLEAVVACMDAQRLALAEVVEMPANNLSVVFVRR